jgi:hypothetical protein
LHEVDCELDRLASLLELLGNSIESIGEHVDPERAAKVSADLARIAHDCLTAASGKLAVLAV